MIEATDADAVTLKVSRSSLRKIGKGRQPRLNQSKLRGQRETLESSQSSPVCHAPTPFSAGKFNVDQSATRRLI